MTTPHHKTTAQIVQNKTSTGHAPGYPAHNNRAAQLNPNAPAWTHTPNCVSLPIPLDLVDEVTALLQRQTNTPPRRRVASSYGPTSSKWLAQLDLHMRDEAPISEMTRAVAQLRRSHVDPRLVEAISARLGAPDEALADFLVEHQLHEPLLALLQTAAEELASHIAAEQPYRRELVDRQYPEATRLAITIPVRGDVDDIIEAHARICNKLFEMPPGCERLHIGLAFVE